MSKFNRPPETVTVRGKRVIIPGDLYYQLAINHYDAVMRGEKVSFDDMINKLPWYEREMIREVQDT